MKSLMRVWTWINKIIKEKNTTKPSPFDIELLDQILAILMDLEMTPKNRLLCGLVLSSYEFEHTQQIKSFLPKFLKKMTHDQMQLAAYHATNCYNETEDFITKMIDIKEPLIFSNNFWFRQEKRYL